MSALTYMLSLLSLLSVSPLCADPISSLLSVYCTEPYSTSLCHPCFSPFSPSASLPLSRPCPFSVHAILGIFLSFRLAPLRLLILFSRLWKFPWMCSQHFRTLQWSFIDRRVGLPVLTINYLLIPKRIVRKQNSYWNYDIWSLNAVRRKENNSVQPRGELWI
jgi:hypothetical protein